MDGRVLRRAREAAGVGLGRLAERVGRDRGHLSRVERGEREPTPALIADYERALGVTVDQGAATLPVEDPGRVAYVAASPGSVDTATLDALAHALATQRRLEDVLGAGPVVGPVQAMLRLVQQVAQQARGPVRPAATGLLSELIQYVGWLHVPSGHWGEAERLFDRAAVAGLEAADPDRTATALSFSAYRALRCGDLSTAEALSSAAASHQDGGANPGLATYLAFQYAEVLARTGERRAAYRQLRVADEATGRLPAADELPASAYWYTPAFFAGSRAFVLGYLGEHEAARRAMAESLAELPPEWANAEWAERRRSVADGSVPPG